MAGISGTAIGAGAGLANNINPLAAGIQMGGRWFVVASAFFGKSSLREPAQHEQVLRAGSREYVVSPILLTLGATSSHERRYDELSAKQRGKLPARLPTLNEVRNDRVLDSALAAGLSFGGWSLLIRSSFPALLPFITPAWANELPLTVRRCQSRTQSYLHGRPSCFRRTIRGQFHTRSQTSIPLRLLLCRRTRSRKHHSHFG